MFLSNSAMNFNHKKSIQTSTFDLNVKECRDVIVKKVSEQGQDAIGAQHTPFGPHSALTICTVVPKCV